MKMFFLTAWLWKGWSRWCLQPHNHKINGRSSKLWSEPTADSGGNRPVHSFIFIFGRNIVAAFRKQYGHVKRQKPSYLFPVLLYIWNSSFRRSVETLIAKTVSSNWNFFSFYFYFFYFLKKVSCDPSGFCGIPSAVLCSKFKRLWGMLYYDKGIVCKFGCQANWGHFFHNDDDDDDDDFNSLSLAFSS